jgi:hypothetical protein
MKNHTLSKFWFSSLIALMLLASCNDREDKQPGTKSTTPVADSIPENLDSVQAIPIKRESITFILGEDKDTKNPYYAEATKYYKNNPEGKTTYLETKCRSLQEVRKFLVKHAPANNLPWGIINLVSHGDQWLGLSVKVTSDSKRTTPERLQEYIEKGIFTLLPDSIIDHQTEIVIRACGVGDNPEFIESFVSVFRTKNFSPEIKAPRLFEFYSTEKNKKGKSESRQYLTKAWMVTYKRDQKPGNILICNMLHNKYPDSGIRWEDALTREQPRFAGDTYHYIFTVPVNFVINAPNVDSIPDLANPDKMMQWIHQQSDITVKLKKIQVPADQFSWNFKKGIARDKTGKRIPAIMVKGYCTILCVLKPLVDETSVSKVSDTAWYYSVGGMDYGGGLLANITPTP